MTALAGTPYSIGNVIDGLFSASYTFYFGNMGLQGLSKIAAVGRRGVNEGLKMFGFDSSRSGSYASKAAAWVPERVSNFFKDDSQYNAKSKKEVPVVDKDNKPVIGSDGKPEMRRPYKNDALPLLTSGVAMSLLALIALDVKETLWRPASPLLNSVLSYISPMQAVLGQSWVADGINHLVGQARSRI